MIPDTKSSYDTSIKNQEGQMAEARDIFKE